MSAAIQNDQTGYVDTNLDRLIECMQELLHDLAKAARLGQAAQAYAKENFSIERFGRDWDKVFQQV
jgi:glycosyltransferase involved in cell wall biosynthesis